MEWGGVGLLAFLPSKKTGGHALKAAFVTEGFPTHHLTVENSPFIAARTWAVGMFKLRAKNNVHHQKESELAKEKKNLLSSSFLSMPAHCSRHCTRKDEHANSVANVCDR